MTTLSRVARADRVVESLRERELDSLLVTDLVNVRYLTGFTGTNGACVVTPDERLFLTDFRYVSQAGSWRATWPSTCVGGPASTMPI